MNSVITDASANTRNGQARRSGQPRQEVSFIETEQKYVLANPGSRFLLLAQYAEFVERYAAELKTKFAFVQQIPYRGGIDRWHELSIGNDCPFVLLHRTGGRIRNELKIKGRQNEGSNRSRIELPLRLHSDASVEHVDKFISFLKQFANFCFQVEIKNEGDIFHGRLEPDTDWFIEVVFSRLECSIFLDGENADQKLNLIVAEIEPHNLPVDQASTMINSYEHTFGWASLRTPFNTVELVKSYFPDIVKACFKQGMFCF